MDTLCKICNVHEASKEWTIWVYSEKRGYDVSIAVCDKCLKHRKHAEHIAAGIVKEQDKVNH